MPPARPVVCIGIEDDAFQQTMMMMTNATAFEPIDQERSCVVGVEALRRVLAQVRDRRQRAAQQCDVDAGGAHEVHRVWEQTLAYYGGVGVVGAAERCKPAHRIATLPERLRRARIPEQASDEARAAVGTAAERDDGGRLCDVGEERERADCLPPDVRVLRREQRQQRCEAPVDLDRGRGAHRH